MGKTVALTVKDIARLEGVSSRMVQRYVSVGFRGNKLPAVRIGKALVIAEQDYRTWRVQCGFAQPEPEPQREPRPKVEVIALPVPAPLFNPWPQPADPAGPITNAPHEHSSNWPHPLACEAYMQELLRKQIERLRGYSNEQQ